MSTEQPLYQRDPAAYKAHLAEGNASQARKRVGADVVIRNTTGQLLLVDPGYKPDWDLPGGMAEANESPQEAVQREIREELGIDRPIGRMLCVDWVEPHGVWDDSLMFIFDGGFMNDRDAGKLHPSDGELNACTFYGLDKTKELLRPYFWNRVKAALKALDTGIPVYLHNGQRIS